MAGRDQEKPDEEEAAGRLAQDGAGDVMPDPPVEAEKFDGGIFSIVCGALSLICCGLMFLSFEAPSRFLGRVLFFFGVPLAIPTFIMPWIGIVSFSLSKRGGMVVMATGVMLNIVALLAIFASLLFFASQMFAH